ncbi:hypothetical protein JQ600_02530 [Bradyrhizobium sp. AUGA SZCCT0176]|uniref:hypothetical protein n=1 Tax=Bradyrhizobium sp. AUGA SZCCT0176 TaxID=2807664 RepID=UPI001BA669B3|nr:hypothetical protein [Bradyrhizobium sp. AUGA SZCCT0176]MBR1223774.1 hypothetical protein [Bradyrhizobium sp. AUGA SZCCT0176]
MNASIPDQISKDLKDGILAGLTRRVRQDDTLLLAIRGKSIDVYYRGGRILHLTPQSGQSYKVSFDENYSKSKKLDLPESPISTIEHCEDWLRFLPTLKETMNFHFAGNRKSEREFQQLVAWENNRSAIANDTEYFITDVEFADVEQGTRLDMLGLKWLSKDRKFNDRCRPVFIEMKYGINAYDGDSGIKGHIKHLQAILGDEDKKQKLNELIASQFNQLVDLELVKFNPNATIRQAMANGDRATFGTAGKPEVVMLLANHNPRSERLLSILQTIEDPVEFDLRFFNASFAGYGMHEACMLRLDQFIGLLKTWGKELNSTPPPV